MTLPDPDLWPVDIPNYVKNPRFENNTTDWAASGQVPSNLVPNPILWTDTASWQSHDEAGCRFEAPVNLAPKPLTRSGAPMLPSGYNATVASVAGTGESGNGYFTRTTATSAATGGAYASSSEMAVVTAGVTYTASVNLLTIPAGRTMQVQGYWRDASGNAYGSMFYVNSSSTGRVSMTAVAPAGATRLLVAVYVVSAASGEVAEFDGLLVEATSIASSFFPTAAQLSNGQAIWSGTAYASTSSLPPLNLVPNPIFNTDIGGTFSVNGGVRTWISSGGEIGTGYMQVVTPGTVPGEGFSLNARIPAEGGKAYTITERIKVSTAVNMRLRVIEYDSGGTQIVQNYFDWIASGALEWRTGTFTTNAATVEVAVYCYTNTTAAVTMDVHGLMFEQAASAKAFFPTLGQLTAGLVVWTGTANASPSRATGLFGAGTLISRDTSDLAFGSACLKADCDGKFANQGAATAAITVSAATAYIASAHVKATSGETLRLRLVEYATDGKTVIGESYTDFTANGSWQRPSVARTTTTGTRVRLIVNHLTANALAFRLDGVLLEAGSTLLPFFPSAAQISLGQITWSGTAHNSSSSLRSSIARVSDGEGGAIGQANLPRSGLGVTALIAGALPSATYTGRTIVRARPGYEGTVLTPWFSERTAANENVDTQSGAPLTLSGEWQEMKVSNAFGATGSLGWLYFAASQACELEIKMASVTDDAAGPLSFPDGPPANVLGGSFRTNGEAPAFDNLTSPHYLVQKLKGLDCSLLMPLDRANGIADLSGKTTDDAMPNGGFETDTYGWGASGAGVTITRITTQSHSGSACLQVDHDGSALRGAMTTQMRALPSTTYTLTAWVKATAGALMRLELNEYGDDGSTLTDTGYTDFTATGSWQQVTATNTTASGNIQTLRAVVRHQELTALTFYVDDVSLTEPRQVVDLTSMPGIGNGPPGPLGIEDLGSTAFDDSRSERLNTSLRPFRQGGAFTMSCWAKRGNGSNEDCLWGAHSQNSGGSAIPYCTIGATEAVTFRPNVDGGGAFLQIPAGDFPIDQWAMVTLTYDDATGVGNIYLNGTKVATATFTIKLTNGVFGFLVIGAYRQSYGAFNGNMAWFSAHTRVLTAAEIRDVYSTAKGVVRAADATNTVVNPIIDVDTSNWTPESGVTATRSTSEYPTGSARASLSVAVNGAAVKQSVKTTAYWTVAPGSTWTLSAWVKAPTGEAITLRANEYNGSDTFLEHSETAFTATGAWQRVSVTRTVGAGVGLRLVVQHDLATAATFYVSAAQATESATLLDFFPTPAQLASGQIYWTGAAHGSASTLYAETGPLSTMAPRAEANFTLPEGRTRWITKMTALLDGLGGLTGTVGLKFVLVHPTLGEVWLQGTVESGEQAEYVDIALERPLLLEPGEYSIWIVAESFRAVARVGRVSSGYLLWATMFEPFETPYEENTYLANLGFNSAQRALGGVKRDAEAIWENRTVEVSGDARTKRRVTASWHGTYLDPQPTGASLAIAQSDGALEDLVGERLLVETDEGRSAIVYVHKASDLDLDDETQISLSRRAWMQLAAPGDESLRVTTSIVLEGEAA